jgi:glucan-binding YG repeat protein
MFSFLRRKTDFYSGASKQQIEDVVLKVVQKHADLFAKDEEQKQKKKEKEMKKKAEEKKKVCCSIQFFICLYLPNRVLSMQQEVKVTLKETIKPPAAPEEEILELSEDGAFDTALANKSQLPVPPSQPTPVPQDIMEKAIVPTEAEDIEQAEEKAKEEAEEDKTPPRKHYYFSFPGRFLFFVMLSSWERWSNGPFCLDTDSFRSYCANQSPQRNDIENAECGIH